MSEDNDLKILILICSIVLLASLILFYLRENLPSEVISAIEMFSESFFGNVYFNLFARIMYLVIPSAIFSCLIVSLAISNEEVDEEE